MREATFTPQLDDDEPIEEQLIARRRRRRSKQQRRHRHDSRRVPAAQERRRYRRAYRTDRAAAAASSRSRSCVPRMRARSRSWSTTTAGAPIVMNGDIGTVNIPAVMIGTADANVLVDAWRIEATATETTTCASREARARHLRHVAGTGNRGQLLVARTLSERRNFLKPDLTAPGVNILAGTVADVGQRPARRDVSVLLRHVAGRARGHGRRGPAQGSAPRVVAGHAEVGAHDLGLSERHAPDGGATDAVRQRRRPRRPQ